MNMNDEILYAPLPFKAKRDSSWDREGYNRDGKVYPASQASVLAEIPGPGMIVHIWFALSNYNAEEPLFLRKNSLEFYWDDNEFPSVRVPFGDFFGVGHGKIRDYTSALFEMSLNPGAYTASFNCWVKMPFRERAKVVVNNESEAEIRLFHYFDYREMESLPEKLYYFHSNWRAEMPRRATPLIDGKEGPNLTGDDNYCILDTRGEGNFLGCSLSVDNFSGGWWGEGDDMIFIDDEPFPPSFHGTGSEDYFNQAWGMQNICYPYAGTPLFNVDHVNWEGQWSMYRYHIQDPIPFTKSLRATIENGHNNHRGDDYSSVAYWYQYPIVEALALPEMAERLPRQHEYSS